MIFISYNGQLNISEDYFSDIVYQCSVIADHRVVLFPNFTHLFKQEEVPVSEDEENIDKIACAN